MVHKIKIILIITCSLKIISRIEIKNIEKINKDLFVNLLTFFLIYKY